MRYFLSILVVSMVVIACKKDKVETTPKVKLNSISNKNLAQGESLDLSFGFTDKEGDLDSLYIIRERLNRKGPLVNNTLKYGLPPTSKEAEGEIAINLSYSNGVLLGITPIGSSSFEPDTLKFKVLVMDKEKHKSDTLFINDIIVARR